MPQEDGHKASFFALNCLVVAAAVLVVLGSGDGTKTAQGSALTWVMEINRYRLASGEMPVSVNPAWVVGLRAHIRYLNLTDRALEVGPYASLHTENPASPYYTADGDDEAAASNIGGGASDVGAIDGWLSAPFHAIGILRPGLSQVAFARDPRTGRAALDVLHGSTDSSSTRLPVVFPGRGMSTNLNAFTGEQPSPLTTCGWRSGGLPLIALLSNDPTPLLTARVNGPHGSMTKANGRLCIVTAKTYRTNDRVYGPSGLSILLSDHAVILIPKDTLQRGRYSVSITDPEGSDVRWSFSVSG